MEVAGLDETLKVLSSSLSHIKWRLRSSSKRRLETVVSFGNWVLLFRIGTPFGWINATLKTWVDRTKMAASLTLSLFSFSLYFTSLILSAHSLTSSEDTAALLAMLRAIDPISIPNYSYLSSWNFSVDPCESSGGQFLGILCNFPLDNSSSRVVEIELDGIGYEGFLAPDIGALTELTTINLRDNNFRGPIPNTISNLRKLTRILLSGNFFTGMIPRGIKSIKKLEVIDISNNQLSGSIPSEISGLRGLKHLFLSNNGIYGSIPNMQGLWQLTMLDLSGNQLHGSLPRLPTRLTNLHLSRNILSGHISAGIRPLLHLRILELNDNRFSGIIDDDILTLPEIARVNISSNRFNELRVGKISADTQLQVLDLHNNNLHGQLPVNLVAMEKLTTINLSRNMLTGAIPVEYGSKVGRQWRSLFLDHNFLVGNIPPTMSNGTIMRFRGSLAINCLTCPTTSLLCHGGQRPTTQCIGRNAVNQ